MKESWKRNAALFIGSQTLSLFGSMLVQYAISWYITLETKSGTMMTVAILCGMLPTFFVSPFAGVWADRYNRKMLIMLSDTLIAGTTLVVAILFIFGFRPFWLLFVAMGIRAVGAGIQTPAVNAYLPTLVPEESLMKVNATFGSVQSAIMLVSPMISAALLSFATIEIILFIDVVTAALAVGLLLFFLRQPDEQAVKRTDPLNYFHDLAQGYRYIGSHSYLKRFFIFMGAFNLLCAPVAFLTPLQVTRSFGADVWRLTAIEVAFSVGMTAGGLCLTVWGGWRNRVYTMAFASLIMGLFTIALGVLPWFGPYLIIMGLFGLVIPFFNTPAMVMLQEKVEDEFRGRVFSVMNMIATILMPVGMLLFGPLADKIRIEVLLIVTGIGLSLVALSITASRTLVAAGLPPAKTDGGVYENSGS